MPRRVTILVIGEGAVGKSSLTLSFLKRGFVDEYDPTVEDEFSTECTVENERIEVEIIDTAGQEEYRGLWAESHVQRADGFLMVYDSTTRSTFTALPTFCDIVRNVVSPTDNPPSDWTPHNNNFCFAIIGNKSDLPNRAVTASEGLAFARQGGGLFFETSAKMGVNVEQAFVSLVTAIVKYKDLQGKLTDKSQFSPNVALFEAMEQRQHSASSHPSYNEKNIVRTSSPPHKRKKRKNLQMSRKSSQSIGGLGLSPTRYREKNEEGSSCCVIT